MIGYYARRADEKLTLNHDKERQAERTIPADAVLKGEQKLYIVRPADFREREEMERLLKDSSNGIYIPTEPYVIERIGHIWSELGKWGKNPMKNRWAYANHGDYRDAKFYYTLWSDTHLPYEIVMVDAVRQSIIADAHICGTIKKWQPSGFKIFTSDSEARKFVKQQTIADGLAAGLAAFIQDADLPDQVIVEVTEHHKTNEPHHNRAYGRAQRDFQAAVDAGREHRTFKLQHEEDGFPTQSFSSVSSFI